MSEGKNTTRNQRIDEIRRAAIPVFAAKGFRGTSMSDIAAAAGLSRPALYQYFSSRADIFRSAFELVLQESTDAALAALGADGTLAQRLDGYLQRVIGDGYEALSSTPFGAELMEARHQFAADIADATCAQARKGLRALLKLKTSSDSRTRAAVIDLLNLSPTGLKSTPRK